mmetsp:Transcript_14692/g.46974  ORF Transcript_14692/g.46974 Transcript_14692/m.46974 type:complete len:423 (-) Transcript_14692:43-1311(-)
MDMENTTFTIEPNISACQYRCKMTNGCAHYSYWTPQRNCHLQSAFATPQPMRLLFYSGPPGCMTGRGDNSDTIKIMLQQTSCFRHGKTMRPLDNIPHHTVPSLAKSVLHCQQRCAETQGCAFFEYDDFSDLCHMADSTVKFEELPGDYKIVGKPYCGGTVYFAVHFANIVLEKLEQDAALKKALAHAIEDATLHQRKASDSGTTEVRFSHGKVAKVFQGELNFEGPVTRAKVVLHSGTSGLVGAVSRLKATGRLKIARKVWKAIKPLLPELARVAAGPIGIVKVSAVTMEHTGDSNTTEPDPLGMTDTDRPEMEGEFIMKDEGPSTHSAGAHRRSAGLPSISASTAVLGVGFLASIAVWVSWNMRLWRRGRHMLMSRMQLLSDRPSLGVEEGYRPCTNPREFSGRFSLELAEDSELGLLSQE